MSTTTTIEPGSKVDVSLADAKYLRAAEASGRHILTAKDGSEISLPPDTTLVVTEKPLPPEPTRFSNVKATWAPNIFRRDYAGWYDVTAPAPTGKIKYYTWEQLNKNYGRGELLGLVYDPLAGAVDLFRKPIVLSLSDYYSTAEIKVSAGRYGDIALVVNGVEYDTSTSKMRELAKAILAKTGT